MPREAFTIVSEAFIPGAFTLQTLNRYLAFNDRVSTKVWIQKIKTNQDKSRPEMTKHQGFSEIWPSEMVQNCLISLVLKHNFSTSPWLKNFLKFDLLNGFKMAFLLDLKCSFSILKWLNLLQFLKYNVGKIKTLRGNSMKYQDKSRHQDHFWKIKTNQDKSWHSAHPETDTSSIFNLNYS